MATVLNLQRKIKINLGEIEAFCQTVCLTVDELADSVFSIAFIPDSRMRALNSTFRGKESTTDVLSFPYDADDFDPNKNNLGDIVISAEQAERQAAENQLTLDMEIKQLILHGLLHLCGYDHETDTGEMTAKELGLRAQLRID